MPEQVSAVCVVIVKRVHHSPSESHYYTDMVKGLDREFEQLKKKVSVCV